MQVSVPGMYQNPAPYREQILTYSTALAFTGRSAAPAPPATSRLVAEPRITLFIKFMKASKIGSNDRPSEFCSVTRRPSPPKLHPLRQHSDPRVSFSAAIGGI